MDLDYIKRVGISAAYKGGKVIMQHFGHLDGIRKKGAIDLVTDADTASERKIIATLRQRFPEHAVLAEESGRDGSEQDPLWIVDPLDGTTNFAHGLGLFAVSIAFALKGVMQVGLVLNPISGELFSAVKGQGAELNGRPISISGVQTVADSLLVTGFPYNLHDIFPAVTRRFDSCLKAAQGLRRLGSAALDLCYVACGRFDGFWEQNLKPWDTAAGSLIALEAGACVSDFDNRPHALESTEILATNGHIHAEMLALLNSKDMQ